MKEKRRSREGKYHFLFGAVCSFILVLSINLNDTFFSSMIFPLVSFYNFFNYISVSEQIQLGPTKTAEKPFYEAK